MLNLILLSVMLGAALGDAEVCDNCTRVMDCPEAVKQFEDLRHTTGGNMKARQLFSEIRCGNGPMVCCSKLQDTSEMDHPNINLLPASCGEIIGTRILGGRYATLYQMPWLVLIAHDGEYGHRFACTGTIINSRYILTSASCVVNQEVAGVRVGEYNINYEIDCVDDICEQNIQDIPVEEVIHHRDYIGRPNFENDIALIRLTKDIDFSFRNARPICLPWTKDLLNGSLSNQIATIAGWGLLENSPPSSSLCKTAIPVYPNNDCQDLFSHMTFDNSKFCAGSRRGDSCIGDIGGPLMIEAMYNNTISYVQYGILTKSPRNYASDRPRIYMNVTKYIKWILDNIRH